VASVPVGGFNSTVTSAITVGSSESDLTFGTPVQLIFAGQANTSVGWYNHAGTFTQITDTCDSNSAATTIDSGKVFPAAGSCYINVGSDLIVWTEHYSTFTTYTLTAASSSGGGSSGGGGGSGSYTNPYTIMINGGATQTISPNVTLSLTALAGMNEMWISNDPSFAAGVGTGWIPFQQSYPWTLGATSGNTAVYAEFGSGSPAVSSGSAVASINVGASNVGGTSMTGGMSMQQAQLLNALIAELKVLLQQAQAEGMVLTPGEAAYLNMGSTAPMLSSLTTDLTVGARGANVSALQAFLIAQGKGSAASALSAASATGYFGSLTKSALAEYQKAVGIKPATGYFGSITRAYLKSMGF
jgi:hypothetical protein